MSTNTYPIGQHAAEFYTRLIEDDPQIQRVSILQFQRPVRLQERMTLSVDEKRLVEAARTDNLDTGLSFWDLLICRVLEEPTAGRRLLEQALYHQSVNETAVHYSRKRLIDGELLKLTARKTGDVIAVSTEVVTSHSTTKHMPMLDFLCQPSDDNLRTCIETCRLLFRGRYWLLDSGKSYHGVASGLVVYDEWITLMARAILFGPIVDRAYIAHQMIEKKGCLRISATRTDGIPPYLVYDSFEEIPFARASEN